MGTIIQMFKISKNKWVSIGLLILVIIISLVMLMIFPTFTRNNGKEGFKEGLLVQSEIDKINAILDTYNTTTEKISSDAINSLSKKMPTFNLSMSEQVAIQPIISDTSRTSKFKIDAIAQMNSTNAQLSTFIAEITGKIFAATNVMLNSISALNIMEESDTTFYSLIKKQKAAPSINDSPTGESSYTLIKTYLTSLSNIPV